MSFCRLKSVLRTATALAPLVLAACGTAAPPTIPDTPPETLFNHAKSSLESGDGAEAIKYFDEVDRQHPYSE